MNAFVKVEPERGAARHARAALSLQAARFPVAGRRDRHRAAGAGDRARPGGVAAGHHPLRERPAAGRVAAIGRLSLPSDRSFETLRAGAAAHRRAARARHRTSSSTRATSTPASSIRSDRPTSEFSIRSTAAPELGDYLKLALRYLPAERRQPRHAASTSRSGTVALNPTLDARRQRIHPAGRRAHPRPATTTCCSCSAWSIPLRGWRQMLSVVTVFTIAHSFTLIGSAFDLAPAGSWFPPFVETAIAASIVYMALENIIGVEARAARPRHRPVRPGPRLRLLVRAAARTSSSPAPTCWCRCSRSTSASRSAS